MITVLAAALFATSVRKTLHFKVDGLDRTAILYAPEKPEAHPPLILAFHGHGGSGMIFERVKKFEEAMPDAVVVYPDGLPAKEPYDKEGEKPGWEYPFRGGSSRDVDLADAILKYCKENYKTVPSKTFAVGHSNGGGMVLCLWASRPKDFAAFCAVSPAPGPALYIQDAKPAFIMGGKEDDLVTPRMIDFEKKRAEKVNKIDTSKVSHDGKITQYLSGSAPLWFWMHDGGHQWPDDGTKLAVQFFQSVLNSKK